MSFTNVSYKCLLHMSFSCRWRSRTRNVLGATTREVTSLHFILHVTYLIRTMAIKQNLQNTYYYIHIYIFIYILYKHTKNPQLLHISIYLLHQYSTAISTIILLSYPLFLPPLPHIPSLSHSLPSLSPISHTVAIELLYPTSTSSDRLHKVPATTVDAMHGILRFLLKSRMIKESLVFVPRMVALYTAMELELSMCRAMLTLTLLQLEIGDVVLVMAVLYTHYLPHLYLSVLLLYSLPYFTSQTFTFTSHLISAYQL